MLGALNCGTRSGCGPRSSPVSMAQVEASCVDNATSAKPAWFCRGLQRGVSGQDHCIGVLDASRASVITNGWHTTQRLSATAGTDQIAENSEQPKRRDDSYSCVMNFGFGLVRGLLAFIPHWLWNVVWHWLGGGNWQALQFLPRIPADIQRNTDITAYCGSQNGALGKHLVRARCQQRTGSE